MLRKNDTVAKWPNYLMILAFVALLFLTACGARTGYAIDQTCTVWTDALVLGSIEDTTETLIALDLEWDIHAAACEGG